MKNFKIFLLVIIVFSVVSTLKISTLRAFEIERLKGYIYENNLLLDVFFKNFPFQALVLSLKSQKNTISVEYEFEIYRKHFFLRDVLLHKEILYQKLYYDPEKNLYCLEDNFGLRNFDNAENAILAITNLESYLIKYPLSSEDKSLKLKVKVTITYTTHLSDNLKYTKKKHFKKIETEKIIDFNELLEKY